MIPRQRKAFLLVALACLVVLVCTTQRMAGLHALVMNASPVAQQSVDGDAPVTPCELSAKSLLATPPIMFEGALFAITLVLAVMAAVPHRPVRRWPPRVISPPRLRVHLRLCVFRE
ncbi:MULTISPECIES: copper resistance protein [Lelliottia]|uniref:Copper resistance protein n=1 Tax=Lelliottia wanjuensis TaxID=3050585 RepID=A0AAP4FUC4_9ENTR|nr:MULTISPECIES: copper resistance protein [unclassified Lelliottia]MDK9363140.1 copper resistance protein [Lelliottia sp. V106_12]MDK9584144.1 copper resistance protein [Lelliottia sp. V86_10]MDK9603581.1 copper resistance protein [Lelliottia sp. V104_15]MDK9618395.1 copper resistance protein [Lelliottia sp. V106_9]